MDALKEANARLLAAAKLVVGNLTTTSYLDDTIVDDEAIDDLELAIAAVESAELRLSLGYDS